MPFSPAWIFVVLGAALVVGASVVAVRTRRDPSRVPGDRTVGLALVAGLGGGLLVPSALTLAGAI